MDCIEILNADGSGTQTNCIELPLDSFSPSSSSSSQSTCLPSPSTVQHPQEISLTSDSIVDIGGNEIQGKILLYKKKKFFYATFVILQL